MEKITQDELMQFRAKFDALLDALFETLGADGQQGGRENARHYLGKQITLYNADYGDLLFDCIHVYDDGSGLYLMHDALDGMEFDAAESAGRGKDCGNNDYELSNIRQWLNSEMEDWFERTHVFDAPPSYADKPGFLHGFDEETLVDIRENGSGDLFFLLSYEDATGGIPYLQAEDGKKLLKKTDRDGDPAWWWLRTPHEDSSCDVRLVSPGGYPDSCGGALSPGGGAAAACVIK